MPTHKKLTLSMLLVLTGLAGLDSGGMAWGQSDFTGDADWVATWQFENGGAFLDDLSANNNDIGLWTGAVLSATAQHGTGSADFEATESDYISATDASLGAKFPGKNGSTNDCFTFTCWVRLETLIGAIIASKNNSFTIGTSLTGADNFYLGYYTTAWTVIRVYPDTAMATGIWYHVGAVWDDPNNVWYIQIYDATNSQFASTTDSTAADMALNNNSFQVGAQNAATFWDGLIDDVRIFSRKLTAADMNSIRADTFDMDTEPNLVAWYDMEGRYLHLDSTANNHLQLPPSPSTALYKEGSGSMTGGVRSIQIADASLSAGFPGKNGAAFGAFSACCWIYPTGTGQRQIVGKGTGYGAGTTAQWGVSIDGEGNPGFMIPTDAGGSDFGVVVTTAIIANNEWYHVGFTYDDDPNTYTWRIYRASTNTVIDTTSGTWDGGFPMNVENGPFWVLNQQGGIYGFTGQLDELVIFKDILTADEIDYIRQGNFPTGPSSNVINWWHRRRQGLHHEPLNLIPLRQTIDLPATTTAGKLSERAAT